MKKVLFSILALVMLTTAVNAQSVIDANDGRNPNDFYQKGIVVGKKPMPYPFLRECDVVWSTTTRLSTSSCIFPKTLQKAHRDV